MPKLLVLYSSTYGHVETMASAVAEGARSVPGVEVTPLFVGVTERAGVGRLFEGCYTAAAAPRFR